MNPAPTRVILKKRCYGPTHPLGGELLPLDAFAIHNGSRDGRQPNCRACDSVIKKRGRLKRVYGLRHVVARATLYEEQHGLCPVCGFTLRWDEFVVDHVPTRGLVRNGARPGEVIALLHRVCNSNGAERHPEAWRAIHESPPVRRANGRVPLVVPGIIDGQIPLV
jgi:hypothetical protein